MVHSKKATKQQAEILIISSRYSDCNTKIVIHPAEKHLGLIDSCLKSHGQLPKRSLLTAIAPRRGRV